MSTHNQFNPRSVSHPGVTLEAKICEMGMTVREFATRAATPESAVKAIISGTGSITPELALIFENVTAIPAHFWLARQRKYDEHNARQSMLPCREQSALSKLLLPSTT